MASSENGNRVLGDDDPQAHQGRVMYHSVLCPHNCGRVARVHWSWIVAGRLYHRNYRCAKCHRYVTCLHEFIDDEGVPIIKVARGLAHERGADRGTRMMDFVRVPKVLRNNTGWAIILPCCGRQMESASPWGWTGYYNCCGREWRPKITDDGIFVLTN